MKQPAQSPAQLLAPGRALTLSNVAEGAEGLIISDLARAVAARSNPPAVSLAVACRDGSRMQQLARALEFFAPDLPGSAVSGVGLPTLRPGIAAWRHPGAAANDTGAAFATCRQ